MADQEQNPLDKLIAQETEQQRVERIRVAERKRAAQTTTDELKRRYGVE